MKMGDPGYFEREERHGETTARLRYFTKEAVAFELAKEYLRKEGVNIPKNLHYTDCEPIFGDIEKEIGKIVTQAKGLTIDDASPELKKKLIKDSKEIRDMSIGREYFDKIMQQQKKRVLDKDVEHISYHSHYGKRIDIYEIIEKIQEREKNAALAKDARGKDITD